VALAVLAQKQKQHKVNHKEVINQLNLSDDVQQSLTKIMSEQREGMNAFRKTTLKQRYQSHQERKDYMKHIKNRLKVF
jgi:hypothetical protein